MIDDDLHLVLRIAILHLPECHEVHSDKSF